MGARLAFSVAINVSPDILLLDEVMAVGDLSFRKRSLDRMKSLRDRIRTIVMIAHQMDTIREWCDQVLWLEHGVVVAYGPAKEVTRAYQEASLAPSAQAGPPGLFEDVPLTHAAHVYVQAVYHRGIIEEYSHDVPVGARRFGPEQPVRRRDLARFLCRAGGKNPLQSPTPRFADVPAADPDYGWIERLADGASWAPSPPAEAIGPGAAEFEPERPVNRAELAAFVCRAAGKPPLERPTPTFIDVPPAHPHYGFVERASDPASWPEPLAVGTGTEERRFDPNGLVMRRDAAVVITRAWNLLSEEETAAPEEEPARDGG
jgi:hypothetical protein